MNFKKTLLASLLMISASGALAARDATLTVKGTISPSACTVGFNGGGGAGELEFNVADYNNVEKQLPAKSIPFNITCNPSAAAVTFQFSDNKTGPVGSRFGLGEHNGAQVGWADLRVTNPTVDSKVARVIARIGSNPWVVNLGSVQHGFDIAYSFGDMATITPANANSFDADLTVQPTIAAGLPNGEDIEIAGSATITITQI